MGLNTNKLPLVKEEEDGFTFHVDEEKENH